MTLGALDVKDQLNALGGELSDRLADFQKLLEIVPQYGELTEKFIDKTFASQELLISNVKDIMQMATRFAEKGFELKATVSNQAQALSTQLAAPETSKALADRILLMATQIGVMADRIGEMADRILFMADKIVEFGNKILYTLQLIVYMEQMMINLGTLIHEMIKTLSETILTLSASAMGQQATLQQQGTHKVERKQPLELMYENMNLMLQNMHEFSLKLLEQETEQNKNQLKIRRQHKAQRRETFKANDKL